MVIGACGNNDALGKEDGVGTLDLQAGAILAITACEGKSLGGRGELGDESISLQLCTVSELTAADAGREAKKVLDQRRRSGLSARRVAFQDHRLKSFGSGVNSGRETGWARANDGEIAGSFQLIFTRQGSEQPATPRPPAQRGTPQRQAARRDERGQVATCQMQTFIQGLSVFAVKIDKPMRD